jgi:mannose-6-phosphate isomerase-like protein (cupin superfamily)
MPKTPSKKGPARGRQPTRLQTKRFSAADETRTFPHGRVELLNVPGGVIGRAVFEAGWSWSKDVKPIAKTESCEMAHSLYVLSGRTHVRMDDGEELDLGPGDYAFIPPGHDGWTVGDETCVCLDMAGMAEYAKPSADARTPAERPAPAH